MSGVRKTERVEYPVDKQEQFYWTVFIVCCMLAALGMFVIAGIELNIG